MILPTKKRVFAFSFAFLVCLSIAVGFLMNDYSFFPSGRIWKWIFVGVTMLLAFPIAELYLRFPGILMKAIPKERLEVEANHGKRYFVYMGITILFWFPVFLAYYPGIFAYDVSTQLSQAIKGYSTHHPIIHTLLLQFFYYIVGERVFGNYNAGMVCYTIFQMFILAMSIAYMHLFLYRMNLNRKLRIAILVYTGVLPVYSVLSISMTKDVFFAAFFLVLFISLCYWELVPDFFQKKHKGILYVFSMIGMILFRKNGIYGIILMIIAGLFFWEGEQRKRFITLSVTGILIAISILGILKGITHAERGTVNEILSVPYQQISYVYNTKTEELQQSEIEKIKMFIPSVENYKPHLADPVKNGGEAHLNIEEFISLYFNLLVKYPSSYIKAFLNNTMGYWYLLDESGGEIYGYGLDQRRGFFLTFTMPNYGIEHVSYFPALENLYENWFSLNEYKKNPLLFLSCNMALYFWMTVLCAFYMIDRKCLRGILQITLLLGFIATIYVGPCALIRYIFPIISCILPLLVVIIKPEEPINMET